MATVLPSRYEAAVDLGTLVEHPDNPRRGDAEAIAEGIEEIGFYGALVAQVSTRHVLVGNHRMRAAAAKGLGRLPVIWVDVDDDGARRILLADNRFSDLAFYDDAALVELLAELAAADEGLVGTGYDQTTFELLTQQVAAMGVGGDGVYGGARIGMTPADRQAIYEGADVRSVILPYAGEAYDTVVGGLGRLRAAWSVDTNAEVVARLVAEAPEATP
jgi:hypothetical protein